MKFDSWIPPDLAASRLKNIGYDTSITKNNLHYKKIGREGKITITGDGKVDEWCILKVEDKG